VSPEKRSSMGPMPKPGEDTKGFFRAVVPDHPDISVRPMFGNLAAFVNGNMFMGLFGSELFVRLPEADRQAIAEAGGGPFEPMPGRPMRDYATLPPAWREEPGRVREWAARSLEYAEELPPKAKAKPKPKPKQER
jgi:TfoX/Sxy family transcriptional regulator of competence genes